MDAKSNPGRVLQQIVYGAYGEQSASTPADFNGDGFQDYSDFDDFYAAFVAGLPSSDFNGDGLLDFSDFDDFVVAFEATNPPAAMLPPRIGFGGYQYDSNTGYLLARNRWYDPGLSRWLTRDPAGYVDGMNLYLYVRANPLSLIDPMGLWSGPSDWLKSAAKWGTDQAQNLVNAGYGKTGQALGTAVGFWQGGSQEVVGLVDGAYQIAGDVVGAVAVNVGAMSGETYAEGANIAKVVNAVDQVGVGGVASAVGSQIKEFGKDIAAGDPEAIGHASFTAGTMLLGGALGSEAAVSRTSAGVGEVVAGEAALLESKPVAIARGWKVGDPITNLTAKGDIPSWSAVRQRIWKNEAFSNSAGHSNENLARMQKGLAPQRYNPVTGNLESMELHHNPAQRDGGLFDVRRVWPDDHARIDPFRRTGK